MWHLRHDGATRSVSSSRCDSPVHLRACRREYDAAYHRRTRERRVHQSGPITKSCLPGSGLSRMRPAWTVVGDSTARRCPGTIVPQREKVDDVGSLVSKTHGKRQILEEIAKCDPVCANCHAVRTFCRRGVAQPGRAPALGAGGFVGSNPTTPTSEMRFGCALTAVVASAAMLTVDATAVQPVFSVARLSSADVRRMVGTSWRPGCPVRLAIFGASLPATGASTAASHTGRIVVHRDVAGDVALGLPPPLRRPVSDPPDGPGRRLRRRRTSARSRPTTRPPSTAATSTARRAGRSTRTAARST